MRVAAMFVSTCYLSHPVHADVLAQGAILLLTRTLSRHVHQQPGGRTASHPDLVLNLNLTKNNIHVHHCTIEIRTITTTTTP
jgi:hypothetical protein